MPANAQENVDVVDVEGNVERVVTRAEMRAGRLRHRCTFVIVRSSAGAVLVHRRSDDKDLWPSRWDLCVGGVVTAGEFWEAAALRELSEEIGVDLEADGSASDRLTYLGEASYTDDDVDELCRIWTVTHDGPFAFVDGEVVEVRWVDIDELRAMLGELPFVPDSATVVLPHVLDPATQTMGAGPGSAGAGGETDLAAMLSTLRIERRGEPVTYLSLPRGLQLPPGILAQVAEREGTTVVVEVAEAERRGWPVGFRAVWLTVQVHSSLEAVGLTAVLSGALAEQGIACNVLAGHFHDHLLVPVDRADEAVEVLEGLGRALE